MIHLISPRLHQNKTWKSFIPVKSRRHSREKLSPKPPPLPPCLQLNLQEAFLTLGSWDWDGAWSDSAARCEVRQDCGSMLSPRAQEALSCLCLLRNITSLCRWCSADVPELAHVARPGEVALELPGLKQEWQQEAAHEGSRVPSCTGSIHTRDTQEWHSSYSWS